MTITEEFRILFKAITNALNEYNGGALQRTKEKVKTCKGERCVYVGKRGKKYVKLNGEFVPYKKR